MKAIKELKNNRAPGEDGLPSELFKKGGKPITDKLHKLIVKVWREERIPKDWQGAIILPIFKKGDKELCENYRGISLLSSAYKILSKLILNRLQEYTTPIIGDHQAGFSKGRSTTDQIFILKSIISKYWEYNKGFHALFVDFSKAYDSLNRKSIWKKMEKFGIPKKLINLVKMTTENSKCKVRVEGELSETFEVETGVRQGDGLSPLLFNIAIEDALQMTRQTNLGIKVGSNINVLAFADDVTLLAETKEDLEQLTSIFIQETVQMGLVINDEKTKYIHFERGDHPLTEFNSEGHRFEEVDQFKYLGVLISNKNCEGPEIVNRITLANRCMFACNRILSSKVISQRTKIRIYHTIIRPVLLYGAETWILNKKEENKLIVFENRVLRKIFGPILENGEWRRRHNIEIRNQYNDYDIIAQIKSRRLRWAGHVLRRDRGKLLKEAGLGVPEGKRPLGRPKRRWWDGVKTDISSLGATTEEAEDRELWRTLVGEAKSQLGHRWPWE